MKSCRVCRSPLGDPIYIASAPAITSIMTPLAIDTYVFLCEACGHSQSPDLPDLQAFYDTEYRISLESSEHDQIYAMKEDGAPIYRTDHQSEMALRHLALEHGALILDFGAAKADTLRKMVTARPDIIPHVFDVSSDYCAAWRGWIDKDAQATYDVPEAWVNRFDAVMSHFVIEHVPDPILFLQSIRKLLKQNGKLLLSVPDVASNPGDMIVADHLNHFSKNSLTCALRRAGFIVEEIDEMSFPGAFIVRAVSSSVDEEYYGSPDEAIAMSTTICRTWRGSEAHMIEMKQHFGGRKSAIYGAGFYGSWIQCKIGGTVDIYAFMDQNPNLQGKTHLGHPVIHPDDLPDDVSVIFVALNPRKARSIINQVQSLRKDGLEFVWLDC